MTRLIALAAKWRRAAVHLDAMADERRLSGDHDLAARCRAHAGMYSQRASELESELVLAGVPAAEVAR